MEEQQQTTTNNSKNSMGKFAIPAVVVVIIAVAAIAFFMNSQKNPSTSTTATPTQAAQTQSQPTEAMTASKYKDGTYTAVGEYTTPGGQREIGVSVTVANGVVTGSKVEVKATDPTSKRFQTEFADNYKPMVEGKNIDEITLTKVSGSSLSPMGFMNALEKIKTEAKS